MSKSRYVPILGGLSLLALSGWMASRADDNPSASLGVQLPISHADCIYFGSDREKFAGNSNSRTKAHSLSSLTEQVARTLSYVPPGSSTWSFGQTHQAGSIDSYIQADFAKNGITPAPITTDWEFIRRITLDLTGRIPTPDRVLTFVADTTPNKRANLIEELLAKPEWIDKWTMYFGDLYQNTTVKNTTSLNRYPQGRNAFYQWIHDSLANAKPYNQMATELITASTMDAYNNGPSNWILNGYITGGPSQD